MDSATGFVDLAMKLGLAGLCLIFTLSVVDRLFKFLGSRRQAEIAEAANGETIQETNRLLRDFMARRDEQWKHLNEEIRALRAVDVELLRPRLHDIENVLTVVLGDTQINRDQRQMIIEFMAEIRDSVSRIP